ncbi:MAG: hypothetical protein JOZ02_03855 [Acidobacteria bacterium]|nr:hypothetical protein [Acidobacteriota bacterium]
MSDRTDPHSLPLKERLDRKVSTALALRARRLIVFLTPGYEAPSGGVLSIAALYKESKALRRVHGARVVMCTVPGEPLLPKYTWFENSNYILNLNAVLERCRPLDYLLLHVPEYAAASGQMATWLASAGGPLLRKAREVHFNVMVQNIDLIDEGRLRELTHFGRVTCTTAHEAYSNLATREKLGVTLHRLSVLSGPELYTRSGYREKEQLLIVSHDEHPLKAQVLGQLARALPDLKIEVVGGLTYEDYKRLVGRAKWSLTFGEGLDGYFVEPVYSGGVSFAVFNERFFTPAFARLETVYPSWETLLERMVPDLRRLDDPGPYERCWRQTFDLLGELYGVEKFRENLRKFYRGEYTFP